MIITANIYTQMTWEQHRLDHIAPRLALAGILNPGTTKGEVTAEVNHGRWIVLCECGGAEKAWEERIFMCQSCLNAGHKHQYRKAVFPKDRAKIEALLRKRPIPNRNWHPGETLEQLQRENTEHREELL